MYTTHNTLNLCLYDLFICKKFHACILHIYKHFACAHDPYNADTLLRGYLNTYNTCKIKVKN